MLLRRPRSTLSFAPLALLSIAVAGACGGRVIVDGATGGSGGSGGATTSTSTVTTTTTVSTTTVTTTTTTSTTSTGTGGAPVTNPVISQSPGWFLQAETSVASAPNGFVAAAWIDVNQQNFSAIGYAISTDDGQSFAPIGHVKTPKGGVASDPVLAVDAAGNFWLTWVGYKIQGQNPTDMHIYVAKAPAGSTTFNDPIEASDPNDTALYDKPWITVTNGGEILVTWERDQMPQTFGLVAARSIDGTTFTQTIFQNDPTGQTFRNLAFPCAPRTGGRVWVTYLAYTNSGIDVRLAYSDDGGASWSPETIVNLPSEMVAFDDPTCVAEGNEVWVSYGLTQDMIDPEAGSSDKLYAIRVAHSGDGGLTIDSRIDAQDSNAAKFFMHPQLAREEGGGLDLVYYAGNFDEDPNGSYRRSRAASFGGGFAPSVPVEYPLTYLQARGDPRWLGDYTGIFVRAGKLYTTYTVNTSGISSVAFGTAKLP
jgi:hypothetical protein